MEICREIEYFINYLPCGVFKKSENPTVNTILSFILDNNFTVKNIEGFIVKKSFNNFFYTVEKGEELAGVDFIPSTIQNPSSFRELNMVLSDMLYEGENVACLIIDENKDVFQLFNWDNIISPLTVYDTSDMELYSPLSEQDLIVTTFANIESLNHLDCKSIVILTKAELVQFLEDDLERTICINKVYNGLEFKDSCLDKGWVCYNTDFIKSFSPRAKARTLRGEV